MLVLPCKVHYLGNLRFRHLIGINATDPDAPLVHMEHDSCGLFPTLVEKPLENMNNELHGGIVVIEQQNLVEAGLLGFRLSPGDDTRMRPVLGAPSLSSHGRFAARHSRARSESRLYRCSRR